MLKRLRGKTEDAYPGGEEEEGATPVTPACPGG